ncbi:HpcH/HpaI aldolase/citrate lyase family protein [Nocardioides solisilvae]|uniref:HpcH/HpaI aldolase/citrate lyase family protein n=1 Tax=Nocardioides solisilvae TaxID=1542435 RepID=UPI000D744142|nr:aldolase/citrate lyase family protein [Nocardioides solisilvae]
MSTSELVAAAATWLFVPGDRPERFDKAAAAGADVVVLDLEDAVAPAQRPDARDAVAAWLPTAGVSCAVRVNAGADRAADVAALAGLPGPVVVVAAKAEDPDDLAGLLAALPSGSTAVALVETARGVLAAPALAAVPGVVRLAVGTFDLAAELGVDPEDATALAATRGALVLASAAAGLAGPVDGVTAALDDPDLLTRDTAASARLGFAGKLCIHPRQVPVVRAAFAPADDEVRWAERVLAAAQDDGVAVVDGRMVDKPVVDRARRVLSRALPPAAPQAAPHASAETPSPQEETR